MSLPNMVNLWIQDNHSSFNPLCTLGKDTRECEGQEVKGLLSPFKGFPENSISLDDIASHVLLQSSPAAEEAGQYKLFSWVPCFLKEYQNFFEKWRRMDTNIQIKGPPYSWKLANYFICLNENDH